MKTHPYLVPFDTLPITATELDRAMAVNLLKLIIEFGYEIKPQK